MGAISCSRLQGDALKLPVLVSYAYARKQRPKFEALISNPKVELLLDCGAFTAKNAGEVIELDDYCAFLNDYGERIFRYLALDVVGDPIATDRNLQIMLDRGYSPAPVHVRGDDEARMNELFELSDFVALAGLRIPGRGQCDGSYIKTKMDWVNGRMVHWLGFVRPEYFHLGPYSCDSASWSSGEQYGNMHCYLGNGRFLTKQFQTRASVWANRRARDLVLQTGVSQAEFNDQRFWTSNRGMQGWRYMTVLVSGESWMRYIVDIYRRYRTKIFLASTLTDPQLAAIEYGFAVNEGLYDGNDGLLPVQV